MITLVKDTINKDDINQLIDWLKTYPRLTKGPLTIEFEKQFAEYLGVKYATFVNSGSSANLLALYTLIENGTLKRGDKIVVPAVSWATDLSPVFQLHLDPILCDVELKTLSVDVDHLENIFQVYSPKVLMLVHVLGFVCDIEKIKTLCEQYNVILIEDTCESLASCFGDKKLGTFGNISTFSFYFGHHISTIEGGMICTDDPELNDLFKSLRNHGWGRDWNLETQTKMRQKHNINVFDSLYTFYYSGFNIRSTDLQAFLGINQLKKLNEYAQKRYKNCQLYLNNLDSKLWKPEINPINFVNNFAWPLLLDNKQNVINELLKNNIECRPLICGSMGHQPFYIKNKNKQHLKNADKIHYNGLYVPNHHEIEEKDILFICDIINKLNV